MLRVIAKALLDLDQIEKFNKKDFKPAVLEWTGFKSSNSTYRKPDFKIKRESSFEKEVDWQMVWDEDDLPAEFPQHIYCTAERPDIVVWSERGKEVILVELTVGDESNFSDQVARKEARYNRELIPGLLGSGWKARLFTVEIGCRGFWHHTLPALLNYFGVAKRVKKEVFQEAALVALKCSYAIWLARENKKWSPCYNIAQRPTVLPSTE